MSERKRATAEVVLEAATAEITTGAAPDGPSYFVTRLYGIWHAPSRIFCLVSGTGPSGPVARHLNFQTRYEASAYIDSHKLDPAAFTPKEIPAGDFRCDGAPLFAPAEPAPRTYRPATIPVLTEREDAHGS